MPRVIKNKLQDLYCYNITLLLPFLFLFNFVASLLRNCLSYSMHLGRFKFSVLTYSLIALLSGI